MTPLPREVIVGGIYKHHKRGDTYKILHLATDSDTEKSSVVYQAQYGERRVFTRDQNVFLETVLIDGEEKERFTQIS